MAIGRLTQGRRLVMPAVVGQFYVYDHPDNQGFGEQALGAPLSAEMQELDMTDGTPVTVLELDAESNWPLVEWVDSKGIDRITTIEPGQFDLLFVPSGTRKAGKLCQHYQRASL
jgi:hypothetical protein